MLNILTIFILSAVQNVSFSLVSRSRNIDNMKYHMIASLFSNTIWFLTFRELIKSDMDFVLFIPYTTGTLIGSVLGSKISMRIEKMIGATSDGHIKKSDPVGILRWNDLTNVYEIHLGNDHWKPFNNNKV